MVRNLYWRALIRYGAAFFTLEKLGRVSGVSNPAMVAHMRGETLEEFLETRNVPGAQYAPAKRQPPARQADGAPGFRGGFDVGAVETLPTGHPAGVPDAASILASAATVAQPPLLDQPPAELHAAIASLALGGAERIVLEWAACCGPRHRVRLVVLRDAREEWTPPPGIETVRLGGADVLSKLERLGKAIAASTNPVVLCHLLKADERRALARGGAQAVPVLHNARAGWIEPADAVTGAPRVITVSRASAAELLDCGVRVPTAVLKYLPPAPRHRPDARRWWRQRWAIPENALVIGMIGAVKPQKAYTRALRVLAALQERRGAHLVILGGPTGRDGMLAWRALLAQAERLGVAPCVRLPGYVPNASRCLPAFDVFLNTSRYEGLSIATLEALASGLPVVASRVGGQGEVGAPGLSLLAFDAPDTEWAARVAASLRNRPKMPAWLGFPAIRVWTLCHLAPAVVPARGVLFVTANLNAGGAQRSLTNLALELRDRIPLEIAICGDSSADAFSGALRAAGIAHFRTAASRDCFDHAEALVRRIVQKRPATVCFWNVDPKVKLLVAKTLSFAQIRLIDASPGAYAFEELNAARPFQDWIAFGESEYYARLDRLVMKFAGTLPEGVRARTAIISNGVRTPGRITDGFSGRRGRVVVSGRIAPSKYLVEVLDAMRRVWEQRPDAELHVLGPAEERHLEYARAFLHAAGDELNRRVFVHGAAFDAPARLADYDVALVLGEHQGCPNAVLEALAAGVPVVANDSGGTRELVVRGRTGLLLPDRKPDTVARGLLRILSDAALARRLSRSGRAYVVRRFSMDKMAAAYLKLFDSA